MTLNKEVHIGGDSTTRTEQNDQQGQEHCITFQNVLDAAARIDGMAHKTPVLTSKSLDQLASNRKLFFKVEAMQRTGSFKFRGALNATLSMMEDCQKQSTSSGGTTSSGTSTSICMSSVDNEEHNPGQEREIHVVTHSSGNHAAALALAAQIASSHSTTTTTNHTVRATIVMPENAPTIKVNGVKGFGGNIVFTKSTNEARETMADQIVQEHQGSGAACSFIHPSENEQVIAGQGTVCLEFVQQVRDSMGFVGGDLDAVIIPVGGGGLAAGNTIALRGMLGDHVKIILAEPELMDDAKRSKEAGELLGHDNGNELNSVADGLRTTLGPNTWPIVRDLVDDIITVSEEDILRATKLVWERLKVCIEPSAGVGVAVALGDEFATKYRVEDGFEKVGVILCGGNVDVLKIAKLMQEKGL